MLKKTVVILFVTTLVAQVTANIPLLVKLFINVFMLDIDESRTSMLNKNVIIIGLTIF